ncbi:hypothetical protein [Candidatus Finniella inopinata]|uniref:Uncharacterized protein n=1 Tax=Candidatus Finniella inopinata TaxID=1696036 RepID=A0A4Q7DL67_9PROT|nr:hypothetical protein [Candidatus Finniella inopinata]RZI47089.1 hypothetical protein EQU50_00440 [Candidatus Finniella inopinata]
MKFKTLKWIGLALAMTLSTAHAKDPVYWTEFEQRRVPLMQHIQDLSDMKSHYNDTLKNHAKEALIYFFATGGKYGFRTEPATASEYEILVKALTVMTQLHYDKPRGPDHKAQNIPHLNLAKIRQADYKLANDPALQNHFIHAQSIISYTHSVLLYSKDMKLLKRENSDLQLQKIPENVVENLRVYGYISREEYMRTLTVLPTRRDPADLKKMYSHGFTLPLPKVIASVVAPNLAASISEHTNLIQTFFTHDWTEYSPKSTSGERLREIRLFKNIYVKRTDTGYIRTNMAGGTKTGKNLTIDRLVLDSSWSDEQLIAAVLHLGIVDKLYS